MNSNISQDRSDQNGNTTPPADPSFACIRCWRLKKKCDKNSPRCNRCASAGISCIYSEQPPTGRRVVTRPAAAARISMANKSAMAVPQKLDIAAPRRFFSGPNNGPPSPDSDSAGDCPVFHNNVVSKLTAPIYTPFHAIKHEIGAVFELYLETLNTWVPIVAESQYTRLSNRDGSTPDAETCTLLLAIYLVTRQPDDGVGLDELYTSLKRFHSNLYTISTQSVPIIQAGMLLAIYEQGQALHQLSYLTIGACVRLAQAVGMHRTLEKDIELASPSGGEMQEQRHIWWCLVILERILSLTYITNPPPFASSSPKLTDFLPSYWPFTSSPDGSVPLGTTPNIYTRFPEITFPPTSPVGQSVQATYLLSSVFSHISTPQSPELRQAEADYLDLLLMDFMGHVMHKGVQPDGHWQHSCVPMYIVMCALLRLHNHTLSQTSYGHDPAFSAASQRSLMTLQMVARVGTESLEASNKIGAGPMENFLKEYNMPPFLLTPSRDVALLGVHMVRDRVGDQAFWKEMIAFYVGSFERASRKWRLGGEYERVVRGEEERL